ncbi:hypothetical protein ACHWQZ_G001899 [Mnemiopsis leidyi]
MKQWILAYLFLGVFVTSAQGASYEITLTIRNDANAGSTASQFVQITGFGGSETAEHQCQANFNVTNQDVTCTVTEPNAISDYACVKWRSSGSDSLEFTQVRFSIIKLIFLTFHLNIYL